MNFVDINNGHSQRSLQFLQLLQEELTKDFGDTYRKFRIGIISKLQV
jgi:hypothetical protein